jgi:hypothetical protein
MKIAVFKSVNGGQVCGRPRFRGDGLWGRSIGKRREKATSEESVAHSMRLPKISHLGM